MRSRNARRRLESRRGRRRNSGRTERLLSVRRRSYVLGGERAMGMVAVVVGDMAVVDVSQRIVYA